MHHVSDPDALLAKIEQSLKPGAILYVDDYVGLSRHEWLNERRAEDELRYARAEFATLPDEIKLWPLNPPLDLTDPSEMIRSDRIVPAIESRFEIVRYAPYWGNFLFPPSMRGRWDQAATRQDRRMDPPRRGTDR